MYKHVCIQSKKLLTIEKMSNQLMRVVCTDSGCGITCAIIIWVCYA